ncbi:MAG: lytic murein transglycosylase [Boseongicola sp.]|nr:lytic murein transglycosylase [Boseongicola sp.]
MNARAAAGPGVPDAAWPEIGFRRWIDRFRTRARASGIRDGIFDAAFRGVRYNAGVIRSDRRQPEFTRQVWNYLDAVVSDARVRDGRAALQRNRRLLAEIEAKFDVEAAILAAVWGAESDFGACRGDTPLIEALATLAFDGRRARFFEEQLVAALKIVQAGDIPPKRLKGSWAGGMGHTQFIPTTYLDHAVDFRGGGRPDIWSDDPADALASTASFLRRCGWRKGQPWGMEVALSRGFDLALADRRIRKAVNDWTALGVRDARGRRIPGHGFASILIPAGLRGAAFMIFDNFHVFRQYNAADAYVIAVGHLADRLGGGGPLRSGWPRRDRNLGRAERLEMQRLLTARGFDTQGSDGIIGPNTVDAIRAFQASQGLPPDGYASHEVLERLKRDRRFSSIPGSGRSRRRLPEDRRR